MSDTGAIAYRLEGRVGFDNLAEIREEGEAAIRDNGERPVIDLSGLENGNSAAVALLMAWYRLAESLGREVAFVRPPVEIENIVELSGLTGLLPLVTDASDSAAEPEIKGAGGMGTGGIDAGGIDSERSTDG